MAAVKKVLIVDDHPMFREGLKSILRYDGNYLVAGEAGNGAEALEKAERLKPDLILMDIVLPDSNGIRLTEKILSFLPQAKVLIISMHSKVEYISEALRAGASGYVVKESASRTLLEGLRAVTKGGFYLDSSLSGDLAARLMTDPKETETAAQNSAYGGLSPREQQILRLLAEGLSSKEIADTLFISPKTVDNHRANIMKKLDLHSMIDLIRYAARLGLIDLDSWKE